MALKKKRAPKLSKKAQQKIVKEYQPMPRPLSKDETAKAYADILALFD
jgi:hypothetical protein